MSKRLDFLSPHSPAECIRRLQALTAKRSVYFATGRLILGSKIQIVVTRFGTSNEAEEAGFRWHATGHALTRSGSTSASVDLRATGQLVRQGASTRVTVDIHLGALTKFIGAFLLFCLAALATIATLMKAVNVDECIKISTGLAFLFAAVCYLYSSTYAGCSSHLAFLIHRVLTVREGNSDNLSVRRETPTRTAYRHTTNFGLREQILVLTWGLLCLGTALYLAISEGPLALVITFLLFGGLFSGIGTRSIFGQRAGSRRSPAVEGLEPAPHLSWSDAGISGDEQDADRDGEKPDWLRHMS